MLERVLTVAVNVQRPGRGPPGSPGQDLPQVSPASPCKFPKAISPDTVFLTTNNAKAKFAKAKLAEATFVKANFAKAKSAQAKCAKATFAKAKYPFLNFQG